MDLDKYMGVWYEIGDILVGLKKELLMLKLSIRYATIMLKLSIDVSKKGKNLMLPVKRM